MDALHKVLLVLALVAIPVLYALLELVFKSGPRSSEGAGNVVKPEEETPKAETTSTVKAKAKPEKQGFNLLPIMLEVKPAPFKTFLIHEQNRKYDGVLVVYGQYRGYVKQTLLLWKGAKHRCVTLGELNDIDASQMDSIYEEALARAHDVARNIFGKKVKKPKDVEVSSPEVVPKPKAEAPEVRTTEIPPQEVKPQTPRPAPIIKGFKAQYIGEIVEAGMKKHITHRNGIAQDYETFTLTLRTPDGDEHITGNDLRRAIADSGAGEGDKVRVIYLKDVELPNGFKKKQYQVVRVS